MGRLAGREQAARLRVEHLQAEISRLGEELATAEGYVARLAITQQTVLEVLAGPDLPEDLSPEQLRALSGDQAPDRVEEQDWVAAEAELVARALRQGLAALSGSPARTAVSAAVTAPALNAAGTAPAAAPPAASTLQGVSTVPTWDRNMKISSLPHAYQPIMKVMSREQGGLRTGQVCEHLGVADDRVATDAVRAKLRRLSQRGWLRRGERGVFAAATG